MRAKRTRIPANSDNQPATPTQTPPGGDLFRQRALAPDPASPIGAVRVGFAVRHPFVYRKRLDKIEGARPGDLVAVYGPGEQLLGYGLYNPRSEIAVRMVFQGADLPDDARWQQRVDVAVCLRRDWLRLDETGDAYRLIHAEADGLPGLVVDRLGDVLSAEVYTLGMYQRAEPILQLLAARCNTRHRLIRPSPQFLSQEGCEPPAIASPELPEQITIQEHGARFRVRFAGGHKTGFFCDQRENRQRLAAFCPGRTVLDLCCYTGGFAVQAMRLGRAAEVTGVDLDEEPLRLAGDNANLNQVRVRFVQSDAFNYVREMLALGRQFDVVVLDPPKWIRSRAELEEGARKHFDLNRLAMRLVKPGGVMLTCCCSGLLKEADFLSMLCSAAYQAGPLLSAATADTPERHGPRAMQILARTGAAADHPIASNVPETEYLKAVWMRLN